MIVLNDETEKLIKQDVDRGNIVFAGSIIAQYIENKNSHENLTLALRSIKEDLKEILSHYPEDFYFGQVHFSLLNDVFIEMGWNVKYNTMKTLGCDYEVTITIPNKDFYYKLLGNWFYSKSSLKKEYH